MTPLKRRLLLPMNQACGVIPALLRVHPPRRPMRHFAPMLTLLRCPPGTSAEAGAGVHGAAGRDGASAGCSHGEGSREPLDPATLAKLRQLDPDGERHFLPKVLQAYERSLERHLTALEEAAAAGDLPRAGAQAHALKSSSASIGALALAAACADVERRARAADATVLGAPLRTLVEEGLRAGAAVRAMLAS